MRLTPPAAATWLVALVVGGLGVLLYTRVLHIAGLGIAPFWLVVVGFVLLLIAPLVKGL